MPAQADRQSASCGIEPGRVVAYKPLLDAAIEHSRHKPDAHDRSAARATSPVT
jgi:hypothetical protein